MSSYIGVPYFQDAELTVVKNRLTTAENTIVANKSTYDTKVAQIDSTTGNHETRLVTAEGKISQIETNITVQVSQAISTQVAQVTFDSLKQELTENTQGDLARALADAVAETVQNSVIDSKVAQVAYDADKAEQGVTNTGFDTKLQALEEFINVFLAANVLKYDSNTQTYSYTGVSQGIALTAPAPAPAPAPTVTPVINFNSINASLKQFTLIVAQPSSGTLDVKFGYNATFTGVYTVQYGTNYVTLSENDWNLFSTGQPISIYPTDSPVAINNSSGQMAYQVFPAPSLFLTVSNVVYNSAGSYATFTVTSSSTFGTGSTTIYASNNQYEVALLNENLTLKSTFTAGEITTCRVNITPSPTSSQTFKLISYNPSTICSDDFTVTV